MFKKVHIRSFEVGLKFRRGEFVGLLAPGKRFVCTWFGRTTVRIVSKRDPWLNDEQLDVIVKSLSEKGSDPLEAISRGWVCNLCANRKRSPGLFVIREFSAAGSR